MEDVDDNEVEGEELPKLSLEVKLKELLRNLNSDEFKLCLNASKDFIKLLGGHAGGELLRLYVQASSKLTELDQAWNLQLGKPGFSHVLKVISAILSNPDGVCKSNDTGGVGISRALDKFARSIIEEKLGELYKELNSKEAKRQNAALLLLASVVRRGSGLAADVAKSFDFKLPIFPKLAEYKAKRIGTTRKHSTRQAFVGFAMSFLEVGKPGLLRWVLQQKEMYSGVLRGIGSDDDETVVYVLSTLRDMVLIPGSLVPPSLRSVLFGSITLEQLVNISGRKDGGVAAELAHRVLVIACTDPSNGLMPDLNRQPNPLKGNIKRLLDLMKKLKATEVDHHRDLLLAIVKGRPLFGSAYMDEFPYNVEDNASPNWFAAVSLAANLISSVGSGLSFNFKPEDPPMFSNPDVQSLIKCICPHQFSRAVVNKGLLHTNSFMKHGTLRLVLEELKLLDSFISAIESNYCSSDHMRHKWSSLKQNIQNEVRILLPDTQVLLSLLSSLSTHSKSPESSLKRTADFDISLEQGVRTFKRFKTDKRDDVDILVSGVCDLSEISSQDTGVVPSLHDEDDVNAGDDNAVVVADIWGLRQCSEGGLTIKNEQTHFYSRLLDAFKIYHRTIPAVVEGSFDFFRFLPSNPLALPTSLQQSLLSLLLDLIGWSSKCKIPVRIPPLMYKHLQPFVKLLLYSPSKDIKDQAYILARAAMLSTGAFDKNLREIGAWFLFLPGYNTGNIVGDQAIEVFQNLFSVIVSFICDAVSTVGNNLFKYWDVLRHHICHLKDVEDVSPEFGPLFICVLEKCLRVISSESGTFTTPEKSMIALYVCNTIKYLLQTQVEKELLCSLVDHLLSGRFKDEDCFSLDDGDAQDLCEWRPLKSLFLFSRNIRNPQRNCSISRIERKLVHSNGSFSNMLGEVRRVLGTGSDIELIGISKAFVLSILSTPPAVILQHFPSVISAAKNLSGFPFSVLSSIFFLEPNLLFEVSKLWPEMFYNGLQSFIDMVHGKEPMIDDVDIDAIESSSAAFCLFLKQAPFYVLFPCTVIIDGFCVLEGSNLQYLLQHKFPEVATDGFVSSVLLVLFWFCQIRLSYGIKPLAELEQLSGTCSILIEEMLGLLQDSPSHSISEVAEVIIRHPAVTLSLQNPLGHKEFPEGIFWESTEDSFVLARQGIHKMDHHVLNLLTLVSKCLVTCCTGQKFDSGVEYLKKRFLGSFKALVKKLDRLFRDRFDECIKTGDLRPLTPTLYALHTLIHFISPLELLELVLWIFSKIDLGDSTLCVSSDFSSLLVGLSIAGSAFDMLSTYLQKPNTQEISSDIFWEMEEKPFNILPFESIYFQLIKLAMRFELDAVDLCLLKAVNATHKRKAMHTQCFPLSMDLSRVMHNTPVEVLSQFIRKTSMTRSKMLFLLTELSPIHLSVFGHCFSDVMIEYSLPNDNMTDGTCSNKLSDDNFLMLLPTALSYLISASMKYGEQFHKCVRSISSFYSTILFRSFSDWKSYVNKDIFKMECIEFLPSSMEELLNLLSQSLLGKSICMLGYYFAFNGDAVKLRKRLKLFNSICPHSGSANEDLLDCDVREIDAFSLDQSLNLVNRVVAKIYFCRMLLLPKSNQIRALLKEDGNSKEIYSEVGSNKKYSSRVRFMNFLVHTWHILVRKFPSDTDDPEKLTGKNCVFRFLEAFILRNILELAREISSCPFIEQLARLSLLHRFGDPSTLKMLRGVLALLSGGNSHILVLQLLLSHSQFGPSVHSSFQSSEGSQFGLIFRPMASILRLLTVPFTDESAVNGETRLQKTSEMCRKKLEVVRLLRALFRMKAHQGSFDFEKDIHANPRELLFLLLSSYGATLSEVDLEIFSLMLEIESSNVSNSGSIAEMDYLWGSAAIRIRKEREREQDLSSHMMKDVQAVEDRRTQFRENLPIDPKLCAYTVLHFPYGRNAVEVQSGDSDDMNEISCPNVEQVQTYDPVFILRFSIHSLLMGYIEPVEFTSLGLLAIAFVSISSPHEEMRKLGYEALGGFKNALEKCQKRKDLMRLRLLLTYLQNGIEEPWQRIPAITAKFVAEASVILLDPSHDHYSAISKFLMGSARVNMKSVPLFATFLWSSSVNFRADRLWILRLIYAGLDSYDDAQIYIRNNILQILLGFYSSPLSDIESKELILLVVKKSVKVRKLAHHLVEQCSIISWLSSIVSVHCGKKCQAQTNLQFALLNRALEVVNDVISTPDVIEWLKQFALEQLSELSTHLYKLLVGGNLKEKIHLVTSVLKILTSTLKISQERKVYQPHFTLSVEGLFQIYKVVEVCCDGNHSPCAELGLEAILLSTPPGTILCMEADKLCMFVRWATSTALQSSSAEVLQPGATYCDSATLFEPEQSEDSLMSKLLRWLTASVILGRHSLRSASAGMELNFAPDKSNLETLLSFLKLNKNRCGENKCGFGCEEMLAASIFGLHQLLGRDCTLLPSVVSALSLLLLFDLLHLAGSETDNLFGNENTVAALWLRVRCPVEANPSWRWSFHQPWKDLSSKSTDSEKMDELHACQSLLVIISNVIGKKSLQSQFLSHEDLENCAVFNWERSILESQ